MGIKHTRVNDTSGRRCLDTLPDSPLTDLIRTSGEETGQVQRLAHGSNHLGQTRLGSNLLALLLSGGIAASQSQTLLKSRGNGNQRISSRVGLNPFENFGKVLVLLTDVVLLTQVDQVNHRLGSKKEERVDNLDLLTISMLSQQNMMKVNCIKVTQSGGTSSQYGLYVGY